MTVKIETLTPNQAARRERVIDAALELAAEGGYDAVQMRDVAGRAQVALGTIYRYFSSKDHLLAAAQVELWRDQAAHQASLSLPEVQEAIASARPLLSGEFGGFRFTVVGSPLRD